MNHEQKAADTQSPKGVEDAAKEYDWNDINVMSYLMGICEWIKTQDEYKKMLSPESPFYRVAPLTFAKFIYRYNTENGIGWQANQLPGVWTKEKPQFTDDCFLLTATEINGQHHYNAWSINKIFSEEGFYWGWCTMEGEEYGDMADLKADLYKVISAPFAKGERQLPGVEECIAKAIEMGIEDIRDQFKELINFSQGKTI